MNQTIPQLKILTNHNLKLAVVQMTPKAAQHLLEASAKIINRPISHAAVHILEDVIERGEWQLNGESVIIDELGRILDGRHRLTAIADLPETCKHGVPMVMISGVSRECFSSIDLGRKRSAADTLHIAGKLNTSALASCLRNIPVVMGDATFGTTITPTQSLELLRVFPEAEKWTSIFASDGKARNLYPSSFVAVLVVGAAKHGEEIAMDFFHKCSSGIGLKNREPILLLRDRMTQAKNSRAFQMSPRNKLALVIKAWNYYVTNKNMAILKFSSTEDFPVME